MHTSFYHTLNWCAPLRRTIKKKKSYLSHSLGNREEEKDDDGLVFKIFFLCSSSSSSSSSTDYLQRRLVPSNSESVEIDEYVLLTIDPGVVGVNGRL